MDRDKIERLQEVAAATAEALSKVNGVLARKIRPQTEDTEEARRRGETGRGCV